MTPTAPWTPPPELCRKRQIIGLIGALALVALFWVIQRIWAGQAGAASLWGDSLPNVDATQTVLWHIQRDGGWGRLLEGEIYKTGIRAPILYITSGIHLALRGATHDALMLHQLATLSLAALALYGALRRVTGLPALGWLGVLLFVSSPDTIAMAHTFFLETPGVLAVCITLLGFTGLMEGRRWGLFVTAAGLGAGLLSRQQLAALLVLPVLIYALPGMLRLLKARPLTTLLSLIILPFLGALSGRLLAEDGALVAYTPWHTVAGLFAAAALSIWRPRGWADWEVRARDLALSLSAAALMALPWYGARLEAVASHYAGSSTGSFLTLSAAWPLIRFEYIVLGVRSLGPPFLLLMIIGLILALPRLRGLHPTIRLSALALLVAHLTYPLYFHARYIYPLLPFAILLTVYWLPRLGRAAQPLGVALALVALLRLGGWLLPLPLPSYDYPQLYSEQTGWHEGFTWKVLGERPPAPLIFYTLPPYRPVFAAPALLDLVATICPQGERCELYHTDPPGSFRPMANILERDIVGYEAHWVRGGVPLDMVHVGTTAVSGVIHRGDFDLTLWLREHPDRDWEVVRIEPTFGNMRIALLRAHGEGHGQPRRPPGEVFRWADFGIF